MKQSIINYLEQAPLQLKSCDEGYDMNEMREIFIARVESEGFRVVVPADYELQIDIDSDAHYETFLRSLESVARNLLDAEAWMISVHPSKSGLPRRHITIELPFYVGGWERIALQAALGSDPMRELLSAILLIRGDSFPTLFVEPAETPKPVGFNDWLDSI